MLYISILIKIIYNSDTKGIYVHCGRRFTFKQVLMNLKKLDGSDELNRKY